MRTREVIGGHILRELVPGLQKAAAKVAQAEADLRVRKPRFLF